MSKILTEEENNIAHLLVSIKHIEEKKYIDIFIKNPLGISGYINFVNVIYHSDMSIEKKHNIFYRMLLKIKINIKRYKLNIPIIQFDFLSSFDDLYYLINHYISYNNLIITSIN